MTSALYIIGFVLLFGIPLLVLDHCVQFEDSEDYRYEKEKCYLD